MEHLYIRGKYVGEVCNSIYYTTRSFSKHYFRKFKGYGISLFILHELIDRGIDNIIVRVTDKEEEHLFKVSDYMYGEDYTFNMDKQKIVSIQ